MKTDKDIAVGLLEQSSAEIKVLRRRVELQSARLGMFDTIMTLLDTRLASTGGIMSPDITFEIDRYVDHWNNQPVHSPSENDTQPSRTQ